MEKVILDYIKSRYNIVIVLRRRIERNLISSLLLDFMASDGKYYSFLIFYNSTQIFTDLTPRLGIGYLELGHYLDENVRIFNSKENWSNGRYASSIPTVFNEHLNVHLESFLKNFDYTLYGDYRVSGLKVSLEPMVSLIIYYTKLGEQQLPLLLSANCCIEVNKDVKEFLDCLELPNIFKYKERCYDDNTGVI